MLLNYTLFIYISLRDTISGAFASLLLDTAKDRAAEESTALFQSERSIMLLWILKKWLFLTMIFFLFFFYILSFIIHLISFVTTCIVLQIFPKHVHHDNVQCSILQRHYIMYSQLLLTYSIIPDSFILQLIKSYHIETHSPHPITP